MNRAGLVLAAHGSTGQPEVNAHIERIADELERRTRFTEVRAAFHQGEPTFATVLDAMRADVITVVPLMASDGYYAGRVLPDELAKNTRYKSVRCHITGSVGGHPRIASLVESRARTLLDRFGFEPETTTLALIAHGTKRSPQGRNTVEHVAGRLRSRDLCGEVIVGLLDEEPSVASVPARATLEGIIVLPFVIGAGFHATADIPERLGIEPPGIAGPFTVTLAGRPIVCDVPIGSDPGIVDVIVDLAGSPDASDRTVQSSEGAT